MMQHITLWQFLFFTYNYLHKFDETAAVCLKCIVQKSKVENLRRHEAMAFRVCVSDCPCRLVTSSWLWFGFTALLRFQM